MILQYYLARRFLWSFTGVFSVLFGLMILFDIMDQIRRFGGENAGLDQLITLTLLSTPAGIYRIIPLIVVIAALAMFLQLARSSELVVARSAGRSAIRSLVAPALVTLVLGVFAVAVMNPLVAATSKQYEVASNEIRQGSENTSAITVDGLWLRQGNADGQTVISAARANLDGTQLFDVSFIAFSATGAPLQRVEAKSATLGNGEWVLTKAKAWPLASGTNPEANSVLHTTLSIPSDLTRDRIRDSFGTPSAIPIWDLPEFIRQLEAAGFSARRHNMWFHMELALPAFMVAMMMISAGFTMRHTRVSRTGSKVLLAVLFGFGLYFIRSFAQILGENGQIPILLAAWAPPLGAIGLSLGLLLHLEDG